MADSDIRYDFDGGVARITLDRPDSANAFSLEVVGSLLAASWQAKRDGARVIVIRGVGRFFSAGGDVAAFATAPDPERYVDDTAEGLHRFVSELHRSDAVVVAAVQGVAAGAGTSLVGAADIVLAARSARFTLGYTKIGFSIDGGASLLTNTLGLHRALHLALLNPMLSAEEAQAMGLVAQVHDDDALDAAVETVVQQLLAASPTANAATKRLIRTVAAPDAETALRAETLSVRHQAGSPDGREGVAAFVAKRSPTFPSAAG